MGFVRPHALTVLVDVVEHLAQGPVGVLVEMAADAVDELIEPVQPVVVLGQPTQVVVERLGGDDRQRPADTVQPRQVGVGVGVPPRRVLRPRVDQQDHPACRLVGDAAGRPDHPSHRLRLQQTTVGVPERGGVRQVPDPTRAVALGVVTAVEQDRGEPAGVGRRRQHVVQRGAPAWLDQLAPTATRLEGEPVPVDVGRGGHHALAVRGPQLVPQTPQVGQGDVVDVLTQLREPQRGAGVAEQQVEVDALDPRVVEESDRVPSVDHGVPGEQRHDRPGRRAADGVHGAVDAPPDRTRLIRMGALTPGPRAARPCRGRTARWPRSPRRRRGRGRGPTARAG